jgi:zinc protease
MLAEAPPTAQERFLDNGLKVVIVPTAAAPVASLMVVYRIGSRDEGLGYTGAAHLLEHMLFKGTPRNNRTNGRAFADIMNEIGASKNATTWLDRTMYFETVPLEFLDLAIELEADRMRAAFIADSDRRSEMTVVRNELERNDNDSMRVLHSATVATAFREHPYHHPTIGWRSDVEGMPNERLRELYDTYYRPENATVFVVGGVHPERTFEKIEREFGAIARAPFEIPSVYTSEPPQAGERSLTIKRPGDTTMVEYAFHVPAMLGQTGVLSASDLAKRAADPQAASDYFALDVLGRILGRGKTSRLSRALVDTGLALDASAWTWSTRDPGLFQIVVHAGPDADPATLRSAVETAVAAIAELGPTQAEIERAARQIAVQRAFARDGTFSLVQRLGEYEAAGSWRFDETYLERVAAITPQDVRDVAQKYLVDDNRTIGTLIPGTPRTHDVVAFEAIPAPKTPAVSVEAAPLIASGAPADARFSDRIERGSAQNGIDWRFVAAPENPTVFVRMLSEAGPALAPERPLVASVLAEMLARGTRSHGRTAIEERLEAAGVRRGYGVDDDAGSSRNPLAFRVFGACAVEDLPLLLETLAEELREPAFDPAELALVKSEIAGGLKIARSDTRFRAHQRFLAMAYEAGDVNAVADIDVLLAELESIDVAALADFHAAHLLDCAPILSASGGLTGERFSGLVAATIGEIPYARPLIKRDLAVRARARRAARENVDLERKSNVDIVLGHASPLVRASADYEAAHLANIVLGQSTLSSRLGLRLRDREGLTYGVTSAFFTTGRVAGPWRVSVSVNPANVAQAIASAREVVGEFATNGPTEREVVQARNSAVGNMRVGLATAGGVAGQLERMAYNEFPDDFVDTYRARMDAISRADIAAAARKHFDEANLLIAAAGTFEAS